MHIFNVEGTQSVVRVVTLHPKETCSCPAGGTCYHIMGARLSIGMKEIPKSKEKDFSMLYKTAKGKSKQKSGTNSKLVIGIKSANGVSKLHMQPHPLQKDGWSCGIYVMKVQIM